MTWLLSLFWKLFSNGHYLVPFFAFFLRIQGAISSGACGLDPSVRFASRSVLGVFCGRLFACVGRHWNSRGASIGDKPCRKRLSAARDQHVGAVVFSVVTE
jgi:hypothetical protein